jgi:hypothetical protein
MSTKPVKLKTKLTKSGDSGWYFLRFPAKVGLRFQTDPKTRRVVCTLNGKHTFQCALLPNKDEFCIVVNKGIRDKLKIEDGSVVQVELVQDTSKYGAPMPEELREVLKQDRKGSKLFHALTPGKQRSLIFMIRGVKDVDRRIHLSLLTIKHLIDNDGVVNGEKLYEEMKRPML